MSRTCSADEAPSSGVSSAEPTTALRGLTSSGGRGDDIPSANGRANLKRVREGLPPCQLTSQLSRRLGTSLQVHESHVLRSRGVFVWCQQCGAYYSSAEPRIRMLKRECQVPSDEGRANLKRIREGLPPR